MFLITFKKGQIPWNKGIPHTDKTKQKIGTANTGRIPSKETREKMSRSQKGKHHSEETKQKMSSWQIGKQYSDKTKKKISNSLSGKNHPLFGKKLPTEWCENISKGKKSTRHHFYGQHLTEEHRKEISKSTSGDKHYNWNNGSSFEPYCTKFNAKFKESVRERFEYECFLCGKPECENGQRLSIHHVSYDKTCLCDNDIKCEFVPLCTSCHSKTNHNRNYWEELILKKLSS